MKRETNNNLSKRTLTIALLNGLKSNSLMALELQRLLIEEQQYNRKETTTSLNLNLTKKTKK
ncbi:MAG: hypothetical protein HFE04_01285 [Bacilli bacterium]|nr:hypothetical protein [Bacilli bacterium]